VKAELKLHVGVIFGGRSGEHEVSLMSARSVLDALDREQYTVTEIGITHDGEWLVGEDVWQRMKDGDTSQLRPAAFLPNPTRHGLYCLQPSSNGAGASEAFMMEPFQDLDVIFPVLHGTFGEDGTLQGVFETAEVAYVGAGVLGSSLAMDKGVFKEVMRAQGVPVLEAIIATRKELADHLDALIDRAEKMAAYPLFTKPANLGSSVGVTKCYNRSDLMEGLLEASRYDRRILVERGVNGREIEVSVLGNDEPVASVPGEIRPAADFYTYEAKYHDDRSELLIPAPISFETSEQARRLAIQAYKAVDCAGMARVDFLLDKDSDQLYLNEINTIPGFTQISMYPKLWEASGLSYAELIDRLIELAIERFEDKSQTETSYSVEAGA